jgi:hypothetical protein
MRESVAREFIEMSTGYAKDTAHVRKQFETSAEQSQRVGSCVTSIAGPNGVAQLYEREGRSFEVGNQVLISSHRKLLLSKGSVRGSGRTPGGVGRSLEPPPLTPKRR